MKLIKSLPKDRSYEQILHHYLVEKNISERLKSSNRVERKIIYSTMYDELFRGVPFHSRLIRRNNDQLTKKINKSKMLLVQKFLNPSIVFLEFAPGDCRFAMEVAKHTKNVYAIDISDQRNQNDIIPKNFSLIIYDGYVLNKIKDDSIDIVFSDQFIEHLHPEDVELHFELVYRILKPGGKYIFRTPHAYTGPHDISQYFSNYPQGFHLKEWTYIDLKRLLKSLNFSKFYGIYFRLSLPYIYFQVCEYVLNMMFSQRYKQIFTRYLVNSVCIVATK